MTWGKTFVWLLRRREFQLAREMVTEKHPLVKGTFYAIIDANQNSPRIPYPNHYERLAHLQ